MPIPKPKPDEERNDFISRCMEAIGDEFDDNDQAVAVCSSTWREAQKSMPTVNDQLLSAIRERQKSYEKQTLFNHGILTADRWVKTVEDCAGTDLCYRFACKGNVSFDDVMKKAAKTLTYNNPDMTLRDIYGEKSTLVDQNGESIEIPKNTLIVFRHVLTTPRKDRDGDILRTDGAEVDPKMLLLWNHVHTLPIGKMLGVALHTPKRLELISAIVDMNELSHDSAVMVEAKMARYSHGFRALEFDSVKEEEGQTTAPGGFDVKRFEIMEETVASVPSNVDAETQEVLLSMVEGGKLTSPLMKSMGKNIKEHRSKQFNIPLNLDLSVSLNGKEIGNENVTGNGNGKAGGKGSCGCGTDPCSCSPEEKNAGGRTKEEISEDEEVKEVSQENADAYNDMGSAICPECGIASMDENGRCPECGATFNQNTRSVVVDGQKMTVYAGMIKGSWEYIEQKLREKAARFLVSNGVDVGEKSWVTSIATYSDHGIICHERYTDLSGYGNSKYYRANWSNRNGEPEWTGNLKEVEIDTDIQVRDKARLQMALKAGRVLSKANYEKLVDVKEDMVEIHKSHVSTRSGKAMSSLAVKKLDDVIHAASPHEANERAVELETKELMTTFLSKATPKECLKMKDILDSLVLAQERSKKTEQFKKKFRSLVGRSS